MRLLKKGKVFFNLWKRDQRGEKLKYRNGNVHCGRYLAEIQQHLEQRKICDIDYHFKEDLWQKRAHCGRHFMNASSQSHDAHLHSRSISHWFNFPNLVAFTDHQTILEALDELLL